MQDMQLEEMINDGWCFVIVSHVRTVCILYDLYLYISIYIYTHIRYMHTSIHTRKYMYLYIYTQIDIDIDNTHICICAMHVVCVHEFCVRSSDSRYRE